jgi:hypothetical protein
MTVSGADTSSSVAAVADVDLDLAACLESRFGRPAEDTASESAPPSASAQPAAAPVRAGALLRSVLWSKLKSVFSRRP